jgi:hypothetical protein
VSIAAGSTMIPDVIAVGNRVWIPEAIAAAIPLRRNGRLIVPSV